MSTQPRKQGGAQRQLAKSLLEEIRPLCREVADEDRALIYVIAANAHACMAIAEEVEELRLRVMNAGKEVYRLRRRIEADE